MNKIYFLLLFSFSCLANDCDSKGYEIAFINGVATDESNAKVGLRRIRNIIGYESYNGEEINYSYIYNDSRSIDGVYYILDDLAETFAQRYEEYHDSQLTHWEGFWETLNQKNNGAVLEYLSSLSSDFTQFFGAYVKEQINKIASYSLDYMSDSFDSSPNTSEVKSKIWLINDTLTWQAKKIILIAHSQGNLWANFAYEGLINYQGYSPESVKVIHIAPASTKVNGDYLLSSEDLVIMFVQTALGSNEILPNISLPITSDDYLGHSLSSVYLKNNQSVNLFKNYVNLSLEKIENPNVNNYLFDIKYDYNDIIRAYHSEPEYGFVDSKKDSKYFNGMGFSSFEQYYYELEFYRYYMSYFFLENYLIDVFGDLNFSLIKKDILSYEQKGDDIKVDQCHDIPEEGAFLFASHLNNNQLFDMGEAIQTTSVTTRYGDEVVNVENTLNEKDMRSDYLRCMNYGIYLDLTANQDFYSDNDISLLERYNLSGTYELNASFLGEHCGQH